MTSCDPLPGDVWLTYLRFSDHPNTGKIRPVVVADMLGDEVLASPHFQTSDSCAFALNMQ